MGRKIWKIDGCSGAIICRAVLLHTSPVSFAQNKSHYIYIIYFFPFFGQNSRMLPPTKLLQIYIVVFSDVLMIKNACWIYHQRPNRFRWQHSRWYSTPVHWVHSYHYLCCCYAWKINSSQYQGTVIQSLSVIVGLQSS